MLNRRTAFANGELVSFGGLPLKAVIANKTARDQYTLQAGEHFGDGEELKPYLQPGDYEHIKQRLQREVERLKQEEDQLIETRTRTRRERNRRTARLQGLAYGWGLL